MSEPRKARPSGDADLIARVRAAARQEQFLDVVSAEEARARFEKHLDLTPLAAETVPLADALARVLAHDVVAAVDAPPFDRSNVDGFALRAADTVGASDATPKIFRLNAEVIACGDAPALEVAPGTATTIATGGVIPRGADAVVMIEHTELIEQGRRASSCAAPPRPGSSSPTPAPTSRAARHCYGAARASARARSACWRPAGLRSIDVVRRPKVAVLSTGDELVAPGQPMQPGRRLRQQRRHHRGRDHGSRRRAAGAGRFSRRRGGAGKGGARGAWRQRHGGALGRHLERRRRSVARHRVAAGHARHPGARRRAQARQAALPRRGRRQSRSWCCPAFRPRRSLRFMPSSRR